MAIPIQFILIFGLSEINEVIGSDFDGYVIFVMFQFDVVRCERDWGNICEESFAATSLLLTNSLEKNILVGRLSGNRLLSEIIARPFIPP